MFQLSWQNLIQVLYSFPASVWLKIDLRCSQLGIEWVKECPKMPKADWSSNQILLDGDNEIYAIVIDIRIMVISI